MKLTIVTPICALVSDYTEEELASLKKQLTYTNTGVKHLLKRHSANIFWKGRNFLTWREKGEELQKELVKTLVFECDQGIYIRPGSIPYLTGLDLQIENRVVYPTPKKIPWFKALPFELHPYQNSSVEKLIAGKHDNVSLTTGSGKSAVILKICRELGLKTVIVTPGKGIFNESKDNFEKHFGTGKVGLFGDGKKKLGKLFTICISDSLTNIQPGTPEYEFFSTADVLIVDESHSFAAESLEEVCHGVLSLIPYRFFLSATQVRGDGTLPLLQSIIGPTVETLTTADAVKQGFICPHEFKIVSLDSTNPDYEDSDPLNMKRAHFLRNGNIAAFIARLCNASWTKREQTLVLVEELSQIQALIPLLKVPFVVAHSEKNKTRLAEMGFDKVDIKESIETFNKGEAAVMIGTACIRTGVNVFMHNCVNWVGGASEIATKQGVIGRACRFGRSNPWADKCLPKEKAVIWDFDVPGFITERHLGQRLSYYNESEAPIQYIRIK